MKISLASALCLDRRPQEALEVLDSIIVPTDELRGETPRYIATTYRNAGKPERCMAMLFMGYEDQTFRGMLSPFHHEEYKRRRFESIWTSALLGAEVLRLELVRLQEDADAGYRFKPERYPASAATINMASEGLAHVVWIRNTVLPAL